MIEDIGKKAGIYVAKLTKRSKRILNITYSGFDKTAIGTAYISGYQQALNDVAQLIKESKAPNVKKLLEIIEQ